MKKTIATIGYQSATVASFLDALRAADVKLLVDVRAVAMSRRPGFAKSALTANLRDAGIDYLHLRKLGTPADGRAAARAGDHAGMKRIFLEQLATDDAQAELHILAELAKQERRLCLLCFEANPEHCHRRIVAEALRKLVPINVLDLAPDVEE